MERCYGCGSKNTAHLFQVYGEYRRFCSVCYEMIMDYIESMHHAGQLPPRHPRVG